jgi:hypothetical protein
MVSCSIKPLFLSNINDVNISLDKIEFTFSCPTTANALGLRQEQNRGETNGKPK